MSAPNEVTPIGELVLARLLVAGDKGATSADFKKALGPLLGHGSTGPAPAERVEQTLAELTKAGLVARVRKGKTTRNSLTAEGRRRVLEILGLDLLAPKTTWGQLL